MGSTGKQCLDLTQAELADRVDLLAEQNAALIERVERIETVLRCLAGATSIIEPRI